MAKNTHRIDILGTSFNIQSEEDPAYLEKVTAYLYQKIHEISGTASQLDPLKISLLASLNIVDELMKERNAARKSGANASSPVASAPAPATASASPVPNEAQETEAEIITSRLIRRIDESLGLF